MKKCSRLSVALMVCGFAAGVGALDLGPSGFFAASALAQGDYVGRVNAVFNDIAQSKRSDLVLLPLLAKMDAVPRALTTPQQAMLLPATAPDFAAAAAWATAPNQKAVLEALHTVTDETDWRRAYAFGQPYGADGIPRELIRDRMYTELGDPPLLGAAQHLYMPALRNMVILANIEATRLAADGKPSDAIDVLIGLAYFGRQMADRQFAVEVTWGFSLILISQERIRDIAYLDMKGARKIDPQRLDDQIKRLKQEDLGYMDLSRMRFPIGNRTAAEQLIARVSKPDDSIDTPQFASTLSRLGSTQHPLRLFSEAGRWQDIAAQQVGGAAALRTTGDIYNNWSRRFGLAYYDTENTQSTTYERTPLASLAVIEATTPDLGQLRHLRQKINVENIGTRQSLALLGVVLTRGEIPLLITAIRPRWVPTIEPDPFDIPSVIGRTGGTNPLEYFVPERQRGSDAHSMQVFTPAGDSNFQVRLRKDTFVLYSRGSDNRNDGALRVQNTAEVVQNADYLIWPPVISLYRQHLIDRGELKH